MISVLSSGSCRLTTILYNEYNIDKIINKKQQFDDYKQPFRVNTGFITVD